MDIPWDRVEAALNKGLPQDYKELADPYGPDAFCDYLGIFHPHGTTESSHLTDPVPERARAHLRKDHDQSTHPVPRDPDPPFTDGVTDNGKYIFWITEPKTAPDAWRVAVNEARGPRRYLHDGTLTNFLAAVLSGRVRVPQFPDSILDPPLEFHPARPVLWKPEPIVSHGPADTGAIHAWARANDHDAPMRGRIPHETLDAWETGQAPGVTKAVRRRPRDLPTRPVQRHPAYRRALLPHRGRGHHPPPCPSPARSGRMRPACPTRGLHPAVHPQSPGRPAASRRRRRPL
ncbi:Lsr2 family protein [Streptomyces sudanensis]|nr:Lsr2 family protein [Streptomyces sudanensis]MCP9985328.1 Lsr2 family protein [Streptomyces sudanensis]MCP9989206.1 Lsr2 family protein [Streptomyces sudanensis]